MAETIIRTFATRYPNPRGLVYVKPYLWCVFGDDNRIVQMDVNGVVLNDFPSPGAGPRGLTFDGKYFWHSDSTDRTIYCLDYRMQVVAEYPSPYDSPRAMSWDGNNLWIQEFGDLARAMLFTLEYQLQQIYALQHTDINGQFFFSSFFYYSDRTTVKIYKRHKSGRHVDNFATTATKPNGLACDGQYMYLAAGDAQLIYVLGMI